MLWARYVPHHKQKIAFLLSAMRHFAQDLQAEGVRVDCIALDDAANTHSLTGALGRATARNNPASVVVTEPGFLCRAAIRWAASGTLTRKTARPRPAV